jgi:hypothetical protein
MDLIPQINNANGIANIKTNANEIPKVGIGGPSIIPAIDPPVIQATPQPVIRGLALPIFDNPDTSIKYPVINVPTQEEFDAAVKAEKQKEQEQKEEKSRGLPDAKPVLPQVQVPVQNSQDNRIISDDVAKTSNLGVPVIEVPIIGEVPVPPKEQVILAGTTATASVAAALIGKSLVEWMVGKMKPIVQQLFTRAKKLLNKDLTDYEIQLFFAFEKQQQMKKVAKLLKKEQKKQKLEQYKKAHK